MAADLITDPYSEAANALFDIITDEFAPEGFRVLHDNLHPAVGAEGTRIGIAPEAEVPVTTNLIVNDIRIVVKFHGRFNGEVDPNMRVDPRKVTNYAERFRRAIQRANSLGTQGVWFWNLVSVQYPDDPTGNKTRFWATIVAKGQNSALVETFG